MLAHRTGLVITFLVAAPLEAFAAPPTPKAKPAVNLQTFELQPTLPKADGPRKAVKLDYIMSDDDVISEGAKLTLDAFQKLPAQPPTSHSLVFMDDPTKGASIWLLGDNPAARVSKSPLAPGVTKVPSNSLQLLTKVFRWVFANYPAERRYLHVASHGSGVFGIGTDSGESPYKNSPGKFLPIQGFARALRDGRAESPSTSSSSTPA
jgi:hypothetical protein